MTRRMLLTLIFFLYMASFLPSEVKANSQSSLCLAAYKSFIFIKNKEDLFSKIQSLLPKNQSEERSKAAEAYAEEVVSNLEKHFGPFPPLERAKKIEYEKREYSYDNYVALYQAPYAENSKNFIGEARHIIGNRIYNYPDLLKTFQNHRADIIDGTFFHNLNSSPYSHVQPFDSSKSYTFFISKTAVRSNEKSGTMASTLRVNLRKKSGDTGIEQFMQKQGLRDEEVQAALISAEKSGQNVYEVGRVSNGTKTKKVILAQRLMLHYYLLSKDPKALFILATSSEKLTEYYRSWGFEILTQLKANNSNTTYYIMTAKGTDLSSSLEKEVQTSYPFLRDI